MILLALGGSTMIGFSLGYFASTERDGHRHPHWYLLAMFLVGLALQSVGAALV